MSIDFGLIELVTMSGREGVLAKWRGVQSNDEE